MYQLAQTRVYLLFCCDSSSKNMGFFGIMVPFSQERLKCKDPCKEIVVLNVCTPHKCGACGHITSKDNMLQAERVMRWLWFHFLARSPEESVRAAESSDFMEMKTAYDKGMLLLHPTHFLLGLTHQQQALRQEVAGNFGRSIRFWMKMLPSAE